MHRSRLGTLALAPLLAVTGFAAVTASAPGASAAPAGRTVTIRAEGTDLSGSVRSSRASCRSEVPVVVIRQRGGRGGGDDERFARDTSGTDGSWSTGTTGTGGRFYAKVARSPGCTGDTSPTVRAQRDG